MTIRAPTFVLLGATLTLALCAPRSDVTSPSDLLVVENSLSPWPSGHGEDPPPLGSLVRIDETGTRHVVATDLEDPVWVAGSTDGRDAYVGLFHSGKIAKVQLANGATEIVATNLSCPEGVALDEDTDSLYVVENPVGDECEATFPLKGEAQLTRIDLSSGVQTQVASLRSTPGGEEEGGPHGLAVQGGFAYVSDCPEGAATLTQVNLASGAVMNVTTLTSPSGCAVGGDSYAYVVEQGDVGQLVRVNLVDKPGAPRGTKVVMLDNLAGPMGVAVDVLGGYVHVEERHKNQVQRLSLATGVAEVFTTGLNSPIGLGIVGRDTSSSGV